MPIKHFVPEEIKEITTMLRACGILPTAVIEKYLKAKGKTDEQIAVILNQLVKNKLGFYVSDKKYIAVSLGYNSGDVSPGLVKALYVMIDVLDNVGEYFVHDQREIPHVLSFSNKKVAYNENPFYDVFYIANGTEQTSCYRMFNDFARPGDTYKVIIIVDMEEQVDRLDFDNSPFDIAGFAMVSPNGDVEYIDY